MTNAEKRRIKRLTAINFKKLGQSNRKVRLYYSSFS